MNLNTRTLSLLALAVCPALLMGCAAESSGPTATIDLDPSVHYQTMRAWEATAQAGQYECPSFSTYVDEVMDLAADELGITRLRVAVRTSSEHRSDTYQQLLDEEIEYVDWQKVRYEMVNDNADPDSINWEGFHFTELDQTMEHVVLPLQRRLRAHGDSLAININYTSFTGRSPEGYVHEDPEEYAEFVLATYLYLDEKYGLEPDAWEVILEPETRTPWNGRDIGEAIVATGKRLEAHGFTPAFIAPSTKNTKKASTFIDAMMQVDGVRPYMYEFSYHRYGGATPENVQQVAERGRRYGVPTSMLEYMEADYETLHEDLTTGENASWQHYPLAYCNTSGSPYINIDTSDPERPIVRLSSNGRYYRQYFRYVRPGAVRIGASTTNRVFDPVGFVHPSGDYTVVVKAAGGGTVAITDLPAGSYEISSTVAGSSGYRQEVVDIGQGETLSAFMPGAGVLTVATASEGASEVSH